MLQVVIGVCNLSSSGFGKQKTLCQAAKLQNSNSINAAIREIVVRVRTTTLTTITRLMQTATVIIVTRIIGHCLGLLACIQESRACGKCWLKTLRLLIRFILHHPTPFQVPEITLPRPLPNRFIRIFSWECLGFSPDIQKTRTPLSDASLLSSER